VGKVVLDLSISLDGFIAAPNDGDGGLHNWYFGNDNPQNQKVVQETINSLGALIMGRRSYNMGDQADGFADNPYKAAHFVLTHTPPTKPAKGSTNFTFVTDGIESALAQAKAAAGDKDVVIGGGADIAQQYLNAGLIDELYLHLVPVLLGDGKRLFAVNEKPPVTLERTQVIAAAGVTHLRFTVIR
jgi:dihydrofolate reductase